MQKRWPTVSNVGVGKLAYFRRTERETTSAPSRHGIGGAARINLGDLWSFSIWVNLRTLAVNEENAAGGQVVTAPANGATETPSLPSMRFRPLLSRALWKHRRTFLLTAAAIGALQAECVDFRGWRSAARERWGCLLCGCCGLAAHGGSNAQIENSC
ncbi:MAG: L-serine ammonia-lyase, iron-sulfur-dependent, subunit alpha [Sphingomonadales bacterium]|nr:L-serine ammonia-lyase, iron-sulfur-dependent, subunit alpha [Sphingomonadales bacterium]